MSTADFVNDVAWLLTYPSERRAQDQLDVFLMGGTVPAEPRREPNPECTDCRGEGSVCSCHGFAWSYSNTGGSGCYRDKSRERCKCWRPLTVDAPGVVGAATDESDRHESPPTYRCPSDGFEYVPRYQHADGTWALGRCRECNGPLVHVGEATDGS